MDEVPVQRPPRLVDAHARLIDEDDLAVDPPLKGQRGNPQLRGRPWHVRMVPRDPRELCPVGGHDGCLSEVRPAKNGDDGAVVTRCGAVQGDRDDGVDGFARPRVVLGDRVHEVTYVRDPEVTVADLRQGRQGAHPSARVGGVVGVDATVGAVGEDDDPVVDGVCLAAVLVHARAHVGQANPVNEGQNLARLACPAPPQQRATASLQGMTLHPVGVRSINPDLGEGDRTRSEGITRNGGLPNAVRSDGDGHSASLSVWRAYVPILVLASPACADPTGEDPALTRR